MKNGPNTVKMGSITVKNAGAISASRLLLYSPVKRTLTHSQLPHGFGGGNLAIAPLGRDFFKFRRLKRLATLVDAVGLGNGDTLPLALKNVLPLQLCHRAEYRQHELAGWRGDIDSLLLLTNSTPLAVSRSISSSKSRVLRAKRLMDSTITMSPLLTYSIIFCSSGRFVLLPLMRSM